MRPEIEHPAARRFQQEVAELLELPAGCDDADVRKALLVKGADLVTWYDMRLRAIAEWIDATTVSRTKLSSRRRG